jgi:hypothetical protein
MAKILFPKKIGNPQVIYSYLLSYITELTHFIPSPLMMDCMETRNRRQSDTKHRWNRVYRLRHQEQLSGRWPGFIPVKGHSLRYRIQTYSRANPYKAWSQIAILRHLCARTKLPYRPEYDRRTSYDGHLTNAFLVSKCRTTSSKSANKCE